VSSLTKKIACIGKSGAYPGNCERDLYRVLDLPLESSSITFDINLDFLLNPQRSDTNRKPLMLHFFVSVPQIPQWLLWGEAGGP
jgi:hypothetical protein